MPHRYFTAEVGNGRAALNGTDAHHLADVMRAKIGENVILCDAHAVEYVGTITSIQPGRVEFTVTEGYPSAAETNVVPFFSRYCVAAPKKEEAKNERYCRVAVEAAKQCGRGILPTVELPLPDFNAVCDRFKDYDLVLFFYECGGVSLREVFNKEPGNRAKRIAVVTGSEGGFAAEEAARAAECGAVTVGLGPRILRCETAPLAVLSAVMTLTGNLE